MHSNKLTKLNRNKYKIWCSFFIDQWQIVSITIVPNYTLIDYHITITYYIKLLQIWFIYIWNVGKIEWTFWNKKYLTRIYILFDFDDLIFCFFFQFRFFCRKWSSKFSIRLLVYHWITSSKRLIIYNGQQIVIEIRVWDEYVSWPL